MVSNAQAHGPSRSFADGQALLPRGHGSRHSPRYVDKAGSGAARRHRDGGGGGTAASAAGSREEGRVGEGRGHGKLRRLPPRVHGE